MKTALYARVSTRDKGQNPENQLRELRELALKKGWEVVREYVDYDSGTKANRRELAALMKAAARREFDMVAFWSIDRFSREGVFPTIARLNELGASGVNYFSLKEAEIIDTTRPFGASLVALFAELAGIERKRIVERINAGLDRARAEGKQLGRPKRVFDREKVLKFHREGVSLRDIADRMNISKGTVQNVLAAYRKKSEEAA